VDAVSSDDDGGTIDVIVTPVVDTSAPIVDSGGGLTADTYEAAVATPDDADDAADLDSGPADAAAE
jgi:hypothetical protein